MSMTLKDAKAELLPCPFCGGRNICDTRGQENLRMKFCYDCHAYGPPITEPSPLTTVERWNRRSLPDGVTDEMVERAAKCLCERAAKECNVNAADYWKQYADEYLTEARAALLAALGETKC